MKGRVGINMGKKVKSSTETQPALVSTGLIALGDSKIKSNNNPTINASLKYLEDEYEMHNNSFEFKIDERVIVNNVNLFAAKGSILLKRRPNTKLN
jgi:hypothetical protein